MAKDKRKRERRLVRSKAWIRPDGGFSVRPCVVADLSDDGVRILVDTPSVVAGQFTLLLSRDGRSGRNCRVKWRRGREIGAVFTSAA